MWPTAAFQTTRSPLGCDGVDVASSSVGGVFLIEYLLQYPLHLMNYNKNMSSFSFVSYLLIVICTLWYVQFQK